MSKLCDKKFVLKGSADYLFAYGFHFGQFFCPLWPLSTISTFITDGHGDFMTDPVQRAESVKRQRRHQCFGGFLKVSFMTIKKVRYVRQFQYVKTPQKRYPSGLYVIIYGTCNEYKSPTIAALLTALHTLHTQQLYIHYSSLDINTVL